MSRRLPLLGGSLALAVSAACAVVAERALLPVQP